ncbi:MAG: PQQ-binding-like beta-propeller repeat protein, partial [Planctomycetes bacterium]|nr:PQQ-binding-like beta-propeller repeat protein [Planctomycetota bacterium]
AGVAPQGYIAATKEKLLISGGRTVPAVHDRKTGKFLYYNVSSRTFGKDSGGYGVSVMGEWFFNAPAMYDLNDGEGKLRASAMIVAREGFIGIEKGKLTSYGYQMTGGKEQYTDSRGRKRTRLAFKLPKLWEAAIEGKIDKLFCRAGARLYGGADDGAVVAIDISDKDNIAVCWRGKVEGAPWSMIAASDRLFVVTLEGSIYCFGRDKTAVKRHSLQRSSSEAVADEWSARAADILAKAGDDKGYCVSLGIGSGGLIEELLRRSEFHIIAIDPDQAKVDALRKKMNAAGLYGRRVVAHKGDPFAFGLPKYLAGLIVSEDLHAAGFDPSEQSARAIFEPLRPYGGAAFLPVAPPYQQDFSAWVSAGKLEKAKLEFVGATAVIRRVGALAGSASWTHNYADAAKTVVSADRRVKAPLGLLWFGGPPNDPILPRHGHGPSPQVVNGRLFIEGRNLMRAVDVYTGRVLWERHIKDVGKFYDHTAHYPGAGEIGSNYVSLSDSLYVLLPGKCLKLRADTGETITEFSLPSPDGEKPPVWGWMTVCDDLLVAAASPIKVPLPRRKSKQRHWPGPKPKENPIKTSSITAVPGVEANVDYASASKHLIIMDRNTGKVLWRRTAEYNFRHNSIAVAAGKLFCIDSISPLKLDYLRRRGYDADVHGVLYALDARTGTELWKTSENIFGTWVAYSREFDVLLQAHSSDGRDRAADEVDNGMIAYRGATGEVLWKRLKLKYYGPCMLHHQTIITNGYNGFAVDLLTGKRITRPDPLTGQAVAWQYTRKYGCNTAIASENLITFRSAAAGYVDLISDGGTGNLGGFKSGCTSNLIVADGVLNAPDYTRTCTCSYQNQSSLAMIYMPRAELWTFSKLKWQGGAIKRLGVNFGAPGDRRLPGGSLWLDYPSVGGESPDIPVKVAGDDVHYYRRHASQMAGGLLPW